ERLQGHFQVLWGTLTELARLLHVGIEGPPSQPGMAPKDYLMTKPVQIEKEALRMPTIDAGVRIGVERGPADAHHRRRRTHRPRASEGRRPAAGARFLLRR